MAVVGVGHQPAHQETTSICLILRTERLMRGDRFPGNVLLRLAGALDRVAGPKGAYAFGERCIRQRRFQKAADAFAEAEKLFRESKRDTDPMVVAAMARRAWCLVALDRVEDGRDLYQRALTAKEANRDIQEPTAQKLRDYIKDAEGRLRQ